MIPRIILPLLLSAVILSAQPTSPPEAAARGGRVAWARLITDDPQWRRHSRSDHGLSTYIRTHTSLNLDPEWYSVAPALIDDLTLYPLIFSTDLTSVTKPEERAHLREYFARGGFMLVDACINTTVNPSPDRFLATNTAVFRALIPSVRVEPLTPDHAIYRNYFQPRDTPPHSYMNAVYDPVWARQPLYGVYSGERMIAVISLSGLQCGWDHMTPGDHGEQCMQMVVNIYVEAMTR